MKTVVPFLVSIALLVPLSSRADTVYRCIQDGRTIFSDRPLAVSCTLIKLEVHQPSTEEVARLEEKKRLQGERQREEQEQAARDRLIQAQVDAARAAERQAEAQRRLAERQALEIQRREAVSPYVIWPGYVYPPLHRPLPISGRLPPPSVPVRPPSGNHSHGADRITVGRARR